MPAEEGLRHRLVRLVLDVAPVLLVLVLARPNALLLAGVRVKPRVRVPPLAAQLASYITCVTAPPACAKKGALLKDTTRPTPPLNVRKDESAN